MLAGRPFGDLENNMPRAFTYLRDTFPNARVVDPAVPSNAVSDDLTAAERVIIKNAAVAALNQSWTEVFP